MPNKAMPSLGTPYDTPLAAHRRTLRGSEFSTFPFRKLTQSDLISPNARRQFSIVWYDVLKLVFAVLEILCRRRDDRRCNAQRRVSGVVTYGIPMLVFASLDLYRRRGDARRHSRVSGGSSSLYSKICVGVDRRRDAPRRVASVVSYGVSYIGLGYVETGCSRLD
jgi:hypothetical protein